MYINNIYEHSELIGKENIYIFVPNANLSGGTKEDYVSGLEANFRKTVRRLKFVQDKGQLLSTTVEHAIYIFSFCSRKD